MKGEKRKWDGTCIPGSKLQKKKGSCTLWSPLTCRDTSWDRKGPQRLSGDHSNWCAAGRMEGDCPSGLCHLPADPSLRHTSAGRGWGWCWNLGFRRQPQGEDWGWLCRDSLKGQEYGTAATRGIREETEGCHSSQAPILKWKWKH